MQLWHWATNQHRHQQSASTTEGLVTTAETAQTRKTKDHGVWKRERLVAVLLTTLAPVYQDEINELVDVVVMVNARNSNKHHIIHNVRVHASGAAFKVRAMIDTGTIFNLIAQDLVKKHDISKDNKVPSLTAANRGRLRLYKQHQVAIETYGHNGSWTSDAITIYRSNITVCKLILVMPWNKKAKTAFNWDTDKISFTKGSWVNQDLTLRSKQED